MPDIAVAPPAHDLSMLGLFLQADPVVKAVMLLLVLASLACWAIMVEKTVSLARLRGQIRHFARAVREGGGQGLPSDAGEGLAAGTLGVALREWREGRDEDESRAEFRDRIERAMRAPIAAAARRLEPGLPILATTGSVAPFVGLFGTVWGIMNSFQGIAASNDTSLAVVAPGIAEALFATAIGLVAAIPAVLAYNRFTVGIARLRQEGNAAAAELAAGLARRALPPVSGRVGRVAAAE
ncbi:MotA/TolQ/ExbB proton channel family protein [Roseomonas sp. BN140053]|uniref:MotA/TolQ/ExbB proton channel family protein n=1 Tax=Roseomonas sp. BN140053 TaxID=3391898 RepID=UPI0039E996C9